VQQRYPGLVADLVQGLFTVGNPTAKPGALRLLRGAAKNNGVKLRHLVADGLAGGRVFK
jgi:electron transfer flavoprotein-quinone oxidoreductase